MRYLYNSKTVLLLVLFFFATTAFAAPPNIILIMADDLGYECIGANGGTSYATPVLDQLVTEGVRFENCFANPLCTPSRVKIMTGLYNVRNYERFGLLPRKEITFAHQLKKKGYATCIAGKWQLGSEPDAPTHFGFDEACLWQHTRGRMRKDTKIDSRFVNPRLEINGKPVDYNAGEYGPQVCADFISDFIERKKDQPFLVYYPMILTHCPFDPTPDSEDWDPQRPGSSTYKGDRKTPQKHFGDMVQYMDKMVGQLVAKLQEHGLRENTLILFTGDNGTDKPIKSMFAGQPVPGGKGQMNDRGTRVPLIAHWPAGMKGGRVSDELVDFADFMPTLCEATGAPLPENYPGDGLSFLSTLRGKTGRDKPWVYVWYKGQVFVRNRQYKLLGKQDGSQYSFLRSSGPYQFENLDRGDLQGSEKATRLQLKAVIDRLAQTRPGIKGLPK